MTAASAGPGPEGAAAGNTEPDSHCADSAAQVLSACATLQTACREHLPASGTDTTAGPAALHVAPVADSCASCTATQELLKQVAATISHEMAELQTLVAPLKVLGAVVAHAESAVLAAQHSAQAAQTKAAQAAHALRHAQLEARQTEVQMRGLGQQCAALEQALAAAAAREQALCEALPS